MPTRSVESLPGPITDGLPRALSRPPIPPRVDILLARVLGMADVEPPGESGGRQAAGAAVMVRQAGAIPVALLPHVVQRAAGITF